MATGVPAPTYQWYRGNSGDETNLISGASSATFATPALTSATSYWVRATNASGTADSDTAIIAIDPVTYHVALTGSDVTGDGSQANPWRSIQFAVNSTPDGISGSPVVIRVGPGEYAETSDGSKGQLLVANRRYLHIEGAGPSLGASGTRITTQGFLKSDQYGILRLDDSIGIEVRNLAIGDDRNWSQTAAYLQSTVDVEGISDVRLYQVHLVGPSEATLLAEGNVRSPTAVRAGREGFPNANQAVLRLDHVLVTGHGPFLSNPIGKVFCRHLTVAQTYGLGFDDHFGFLQTPQSFVDDRRYTFESSVFYELKGRLNGQRVGLAVAGGGVDNVYFDANPAGVTQNLLVRAIYNASGPVYYSDAELASPDLIDRSAANPVLTAAHGMFAGDDTSAALTGNLLTRNDLTLRTYDGFAFVSPPGIDSGWMTMPATGAPFVTVQQPAGTSITSGTGRVDYGSVGVTGSAIRTFTIRNDGFSDLTGLAATVTGSSAADYMPQPFGATTLAPGASTTLSVVFAPSVIGNRAATLRIDSNDPTGSPFSISLNGSGVPTSSVTTGPAQWLNSSTTTLTGTVNPNGLATTVQFEYGLTNAYGTVKTVTLSPNNGTTALDVSANLGTLPVGTTYHYRLTATNVGGTTVGEDRTFVTSRTSGDYTYMTSDLHRHHHRLHRGGRSGNHTRHDQRIDGQSDWV